MKSLLILFISFLSLSFASAQLKKVADIKLKGVTHVSIDRLGNFYFVSTDGRIHKYDVNAKQLAVSPPNATPISLLEAWNPLRVFAYYANDSAYHIFDYNLELLEIKKLDPSLAITPTLACPGNEPTVWILDEADLSLKKTNYHTNELILESPIDSMAHYTRFSFMREYQNYLFMAEPGGAIHILNSLGKPVTKLETLQSGYFNFLGEEICFRRNDQLMLFDLYTAEARTLAVVNNPDNILFSIISDERVALVRSDRVEFYRYTLPQN